MTKITLTDPVDARAGEIEVIIAGVLLELAVEVDPATDELRYAATPEGELPSKISVVLKGRDGWRRTVPLATGAEAVQLAKGLNTADLGAKPLFRRIAERLQAVAAEYEGTVTDEPIP